MYLRYLILFQPGNEILFITVAVYHVTKPSWNRVNWTAMNNPIANCNSSWGTLHSPKDYPAKKHECISSSSNLAAKIWLSTKIQFQLFSDSLNITAEYIELSEGTTLIEPQKRALHELTGLSGKSRLVLNNICLEDPARGTLFTNMPNVEFENIKVRDPLLGNCLGV